MLYSRARRRSACCLERRLAGCNLRHQVLATCVHLHAPTAQSTVHKMAYRSIITDTRLQRMCGQDATRRQTCPMKAGVVVVLDWTLVGYSCPSTTGALTAFLRQQGAGGRRNGLVRRENLAASRSLKASSATSALTPFIQQCSGQTKCQQKRHRSLAGGFLIGTCYCCRITVPRAALAAVRW